MNKSLIIIAAALLLGSLASLAANPVTGQPNILWITSEDNGVKWLGCYGGENALTPNLDQLAKEGFRYTNCYDNAAVCAPTRSTWITGMHAISTGTQAMRSSSAVPEQVTFYNQQLQKAGYYTSNCTKTDYNLRGLKPGKYWNHSKSDYTQSWKNRKKGQPFFTVLNLGDSHESRAFGNLKEGSKDPGKMKLRSYHPDIPEMRETYAVYSSSVEKMDEKVGKAIAALKEDGLYEDTIIIYNSDHGGVLPRSKRFLYSSGIHCPLIIRIPEKWKKWWPAEKPGMTVDRMVSFIDMPKTWVSLAQGEVPDVFQGTIFLGDKLEPEPAYHFAWRGRADQRQDCARLTRDKRYAYHKNYAPFAPNGQFLPYMHKMKATGAWEKYHKDGKTNAVTGRFFKPRVSEEFYDNEKDFDNVINLINVPEHQAKIAALKAEMRRQQLACYDSGLLPESLRNNRAKANNMTTYEMIRDPKLYPLEKYLDIADLALARDPANLATFKECLSDPDEGMQYWGLIGLLLLEDKAVPALGNLKLLFDQSMSKQTPYVPYFAAWIIYRNGDKSLGEKLFTQLANSKMKGHTLANIFDWMGDDAKPLLNKIYKGKNLEKGFLSAVITRAGVDFTIATKKKNKNNDR
ncbi:sulfatase [Lentisphaera marina]|uniref:sulfatase family protein n=1 Tax=Lentisphaera marina TaxID=1111041 RepID=UPI002366DFCA|nr:sulfatase [Lentisphaera marina]MDD7987259.1 sulfatase [Lentisphaera marina]